jgi:hypothetical protein
MTTTSFEVLGAAVITSIAIIGKIVENSGHFHTNHRTGGSRVVLYYDSLNFHLHLSLGMLGLAWSQHWDTDYCAPIFILILLGITTKGVLAKPKPVTLSFLDRTAFCGLYLPNILAFICVGWVLLGKGLICLDVQTTPSGVNTNNPAAIVVSGQKSEKSP